MGIRLLGPFVLICIIIGSYEVGSHYRANTSPATAAKTVSAPKPPSSDLEEYLEQVKVVGPLANWMKDEGDRGLGDVQTETPAPPYTASTLDRVLRRPTAAPNNFVHTTFPVETYSAFKILIPPGTISASLTGGFESFTYAAGRQRQAANIQVLLMDDGEFSDFLHHDAGSAIYSIDPCSAQSIKWLLSSDYHKVKKYYFVFHNPDTKAARLLSVKADFTVRFN